MNRAWLVPLWLLVLAAWIYRYAGAGIHSDFNHDDLMNAYQGLFNSWDKILTDIVFFFRSSHIYRPLGAAFYKVFLDVFGYEPLPLRIGCLLLVVANLGVLFFLIVEITGNRLTAAIGTLLYSYHPGLNELYYSTGFIYDLLAYFCYGSALALYINARKRGQPPSYDRSVAVLGLYVLALNSKEIAVSFPLALVLYEIAWHRREPWSRWLRSCHLIPITSLMTIAFLWFKVYSPIGSGNMGGGYLTKFSAGDYLAHLASFLGDILTAHGLLAGWHAIVAIALLAAAAAVAKAPEIAFGLALFLIGILPVAFIPQRDMDAVYIPASGIVICIASLIARSTRKIPPVAVIAAMFAVLWFRYSYPIPGLSVVAERAYIRSIHEQIRPLAKALPKGARVLILDDPYPKDHEFATLYQFSLINGDPTLKVDQKSRLEAEAKPVIPANYQLTVTSANGRISAVSVK